MWTKTDFSGGVMYSNYDTHAAGDDAAQLVAAGAEVTTFAADVRYIMVTHASHACYIAKDATEVVTAASGGADDRVLIPASASGLVFPWSGRDVQFTNITAGETPLLAVVAWY